MNNLYKHQAVKTYIEHKSVRIAANKLRINKTACSIGKISSRKESSPCAKEMVQIQIEGNSQTAESTQKHPVGARYFTGKRWNPSLGQTCSIPVHTRKHRQIFRREDVSGFSGYSLAKTAQKKLRFETTKERIG
ncbi:hypothetical protein ACFSJW_07485 [Flavobacterium artemisiae]|uniref:Uncharacterized protein n=1 Tax=Flavobacterium artemisiae TaxID=2126556 RepID=A0ABW4HBQ6_9FLAO